MATDLVLSTDPPATDALADALADAARQLVALRPDLVGFPLLGADLLVGAARRATAAGAGPVTLEVEPAAADTDVLAAAAGLAPRRELQQLRRPLPLDEPVDVALRAFRPGVDDEAWLEVNNRAFAWHPEQGGWTLDDLHARMAEPWFRADGFLVHDDAGGAIDAFCWTKIHEDHDPPLGEIYVIGVDVAAQGRKLGRSLTLAGLDWLAGEGVTIGMLYVESDNAPAQALYRRLGFGVHHCRRWYS